MFKAWVGEKPRIAISWNPSLRSKKSLSVYFCILALLGNEFVFLCYQLLNLCRVFLPLFLVRLGHGFEAEVPALVRDLQNLFVKLANLILRGNDFGHRSPGN